MTKNKKLVDIAVLGATGLVGENVLSILQEREFPVRNIYFLAGEQSAGKVLRFNGTSHTVLDVANFDFTQVQVAIFSAGSEVSKQYAPHAAEAGCVVIDNTSCFRYDTDVPLVIPEVNPERIADYTKTNIIANPNCSTIQMLVALFPIYKEFGIVNINVATYQSVSGTGRAAISELIDQTALLLNGRPAKPKVYPQQIAFNVLPHIDEFLDNGYSKEEMKMVWETQKIFADPDIKVNATAVRVPVIFGHSEAVTITTNIPISAAQATALLQEAPGVKVSEGYPTVLGDAVGKDDVFVGRIRNAIGDDHQLNMWIVADNVRKGAALNSVQIAEILVANYL